MTRPLSAAFLLLLPAALLAQEPANPTADKKAGKVAGRTVHALSGEAVRKVKLTLGVRGATDFRRLSATSDAEGKFTFDNIEPGTYHLLAQKAGFLDQAYGSSNYSQTGTPLTVSAGGEIKDLEFKLMPQGVITGKVMDEDGEPIPRAMINVLRQGGRGNRPMFFQGESTNDLGEFRIASISPGRYYAVAQVSDFQERGHTPPKKEGPEEYYVATYYPGVTDAASAAAFEVKPGQEVSGIFITMRKSRVFRVSGKISGMTPAHSASSLSVSLTSREREARMTLFGWGGGGSVKPDGSFEVANVSPGSYYASIYLRTDMMPQVVGRAPVDVTDSNVTGVVLPMLEPLNIAGSVRVEGDRKVALDSGMIMLLQADLLPAGGRPARVNADGAFKIEGIGPDKYLLNLWNFPDTVCLKSARLGKQEALDSALDLSEAQGTVNLELIFSAKPATVEGSLRLDAKPIAGGSVMLVREPAIAGRRFLNKSANTDQNGSFTIQGVSPGEYKLYAWQTDQGLEFSPDLDALKPLAEKAVKVAVEEGDTKHFDLTPIKQDDAQAQ